MLGYIRVPDPKSGGQLADRTLAVEQMAQKQQPVSVAKRLKQSAGLVGSLGHPVRIEFHQTLIFVIAKMRNYAYIVNP